MQEPLLEHIASKALVETLQEMVGQLEHLPAGNEHGRGSGSKQRTDAAEAGRHGRTGPHQGLGGGGKQQLQAIALLSCASAAAAASSGAGELSIISAPARLSFVFGYEGLSDEMRFAIFIGCLILFGVFLGILAAVLCYRCCCRLQPEPTTDLTLVASKHLTAECYHWDSTCPTLSKSSQDNLRWLRPCSKCRPDEHIYQAKAKTD